MTARTNTKKVMNYMLIQREIKGRGLIKSLLQDKKIPAIVYGKNFENKAVSLKLADFRESC